MPLRNTRPHRTDRRGTRRHCGPMPLRPHPVAGALACALTSAECALRPSQCVGRAGNQPCGAETLRDGMGRLPCRAGWRTSLRFSSSTVRPARTRSSFLPRPPAFPPRYPTRHDIFHVVPTRYDIPRGMVPHTARSAVQSTIEADLRRSNQIEHHLHCNVISAAWNMH